ncbi:hypothetical protein [Bacillus sp. PS06]|uniref:hypothetical protein n=1 Tax=Bacillus sp. PS06 TaxID=2764176 RepID=UPI0017804CD5|nr:hypothetical protein [Bacillus sp. PS06]MBD8070711.1 hypothetical protein [Bacillus sp. PS06]
MASLKEIKENIIQSVIASVLAVITEKGKTPIDEIEIDGSPIQYVGDVGVLISVLLELHDIFELEFNLDLNLVGDKFKTIESIIEYFMVRLVDEKI